MSGKTSETNGRRKGGVSVTDVAREAGVSVGTVSRVMNREESVDPELRRRVLREARKIGFVPRMHSQHLAVLTGRHNPLMPMGYTSIMTGLIERHASRQGYAIDVIEEENLDLVYDCRIEAAIGVVFHDVIEQLKEVPNLPLLTVNHPMRDRGIHSIYTDHHEQGVKATEYLVAHGHRRIAFLADLPDEWGAAERMSGYRGVLAASDVSFDPALVRYSDDGPVYDVLQRWIRNGVTAILNLSEDAVPEVLHILTNVLGLRIGRDISTITLEDLPIYQYFSPPQTVIRQPLEEMARLAVEKSIELAANRGESGEDPEVLDLCLHGELVERDSVASLDAAAGGSARE